MCHIDLGETKMHTKTKNEYRKTHETYLSTIFDTIENTKITDSPHNGQRYGQLPHNTIWTVYTFRDLQYFIPT